MLWPFAGRDGELRTAVRELSGSSARGIVIVGPPYVGRTRFLDELARTPVGRAERHRCTATRGARDIPFACLGALAPSSVETPHHWLEEFADRAGPDALVLIDDAQWCDPATVQLLAEAGRAGTVRLALAVRSGHRTPQGITALWKDKLLRRIDLAPLSRAASDALVTDVLGGHVAQAVLHELWDVSRGYPLVLREYLQGPVATGTIAQVDGVWVITRPLEAPQTYVDLTRHLLGELPAEVGEAVHLVALGEPLEAEVLDQLASPAVVAALERGGIVVQDPDNGRYAISVPGARMALRAALEPATMRALSRRLSATMIDQELHEDDLVRLALWRLDAGDTTDNSLFVRAAERAASTFDHDVTERLARAGLAGGGAEARILLANALIHQHRPGEAEGHLAEAAERVTTDVDRARVAGLRSRLLFFRLGRMDDGIAVLRAACEEVDDPDVLDQLRGSLALLVSMRGDVGEAVHLCDLVLGREGATDAAKVVAATSAAFARVQRGELRAGKDVAQAGLALPPERVERDYPMARPTLELVLMLADAYLGDFPGSEERARRRLREAIEGGVDELAGLWASQLAGLVLWQGDIRQALRISAEARRHLAPSDPLGMHAVAYAIGVEAAAEGGDIGQAEQLLRDLRTVCPPLTVRGRLIEERAAAMLQAATGGLDDAVRMLTTAIEYGAAHDHWTWVGFTAYHGIRLGRPDGFVDVLEDVADRSDGRLLPATVMHARALRDGDAEGLDAAARELADIGAVLWAAEAYAQACDIAARTADRPRASLLRSRAVALIQRCPGAVTPAIRGLRVTPLTRREHEVAMLAASGLTSPRIADQLVVSVRTVDNHLASVYRKLDIAGRDELPEALATDL